MAPHQLVGDASVREVKLGAEGVLEGAGGRISLAHLDEGWAWGV